METATLPTETRAARYLRDSPHLYPHCRRPEELTPAQRLERLAALLADWLPAIEAAQETEPGRKPSRPA